MGPGGDGIIDAVVHQAQSTTMRSNNGFGGNAVSLYRNCQAMKVQQKLAAPGKKPVEVALWGN